MDFTKLIEWLQLSSGRLLALFVIIVLAAGLVVFAPDKILEPLGIREIPPKYHPWPGISFVVSGIGTLVTGIVCITPLVKREINHRKLLNRRRKRLHNLTPGERLILRRYIENQTRTQWLRLDDGVARELTVERIIRRASTQGHVLKGFPHNIDPWVWDYLNKSPELIQNGAKH